MKNNSASTAILHKLGFLQTHIVKKEFKRDSMELDVIHFILRKS
jgi:hypothetical protein